MADFLSLLTAIPSLMADFSGSTSDPYADQKKQLAGRMAQISAAQTDTSNPLYKQLYGQYQDQNRQNMAQTIAESQAQNRMATANGRTPLFSPERGGETLFRNLMQGYQGLNTQADAQTRQALSTALGGTNSTGNFFNQITPGAAKTNTQQLSGFQGISDILRNLTSGQKNSANTVTQAPQGYQSPYASLYGPRNQNYTDPNANVFPTNQTYGITGGGY